MTMTKTKPREKLLVHNYAKLCDHCRTNIYLDQEHFTVSGKGNSLMYFHKEMADCANGGNNK